MIQCHPMRKFPLFAIASFFACQSPAWPAVGVTGGVEVAAGPVFRWAGGMEGFWEWDPHWALRLGAFVGPEMGHVPLSVAYVFAGDYPLQLRPRVEVGGDLAWGDGTAFGGHLGAGIDYVFDNQWVLSSSVRTYGGQSLPWLTPWSLFLNLGFGMKF